MAEISHPASDPPALTALRALVARGAAGELAKDRFVPLHPAVASLLGVAGLQRGTTVLVEEAAYPGATSLALTLLTEATSQGMWCAVLGLPELGLAAAAELGICLDRLVIVPGVPGREAMFLTTLLEACDIVCAVLAQPLSGLDARRLVARVRERRGVLVVVPAPQLRRVVRRRLWPELSDLTMTVMHARFVGLEEGEGRIGARLVEVALRRRRAPEERRGRLWLPARGGGVTLADGADALEADVPVGMSRVALGR
jgi:hypothetical protein